MISPSLKHLDDAVEVHSETGPAIQLVALEIGLTCAHDFLLVGIEYPLDGLVIRVSLCAEAPQESPLDGEHLDVVDAVPVARPRRGPGREREVLALGDVGDTFERNGTQKSLLRPRNLRRTTSAQGLLRLNMNSRSPAP